jgi:hypothetical protein
VDSLVRGTAVLYVRQVGGQEKRAIRLDLHNTIHIPGLDTGLLSVQSALKRGLCFRPDLDALVDLTGKPVTKLLPMQGVWALDLVEGRPQITEETASKGTCRVRPLASTAGTRV